PLGLHNGDIVKLSFHFFSDASDTALGWYVDAIEFYQLSTEVYNDVILKAITWSVGSTQNPDTIVQGNVVRLGAIVRNNLFGPTATFRVFAKVFNDKGELVYSSSKLVRYLAPGESRTVYFSPDWIPTRVCEYRLSVMIRKVGDPNIENNSMVVPMLVVSATGAAGDGVEIPKVFFMNISGANPFRTSTTIDFGLPKAADVELKVYDIRGRVVKTLVSGSMNAGYHSVKWDGKDESDHRVAAGVYFIKFNAGDFSTMRKVILLE
ncbi:MAG: hypothetical protein DRQ10_03645, partial [Candidatus Hydrothermota bacterium]